MKTALQAYDEIPPGSDKLVEEIRVWTDTLTTAPEEFNNGLWSCHGLVRAADTKWQLGKAGWQVVDGVFGNEGGGHSRPRSWNHAWLYHAIFDLSFVLDVYPVASHGGPMLVDCGIRSPWRGLYRPDAKRFEAHLSKFDREAQEILSHWG